MVNFLIIGKRITHKIGQRDKLSGGVENLAHERNDEDI